VPGAAPLQSLVKGMTMATDPVCGMQVDEEQAESEGLSSEYQGQSYYFCSPGCKQAFDQDPQSYVEQPSG